MSDERADVIAEALEALPEHLDMKQEIDGYAGPGGSSYSDEDKARMEARSTAAREVLEQLYKGGRVVVLSPEAYAMVCGLVAPTEEGDHKRGVWHAGVLGPIEEVQSAFPTDDFWQAVKDGAIEYDEEAGT